MPSKSTKAAVKPQVETALRQLSELVRACEQDFTSDDTEGGEFPLGDDDTVADGHKEAPPTVLTFGDIRRGRSAVETLRELLKDYPQMQNAVKGEVTGYDIWGNFLPSQQLVNEIERLKAVLRDIEMETRDGGQWTPAEINEVARAALKE